MFFNWFHKLKTIEKPQRKKDTPVT